MNLHFKLPWLKPAPLPHVVIRHVAATKAESRLARQKRIDRELELAVSVAQLTPDERAAALSRGARKGRTG